MRNKLIVGLLVVVVIIAAGVVWSIRTKNNAPASPIAAIPQAQPVSQALIASSTKQTGKGSTFHFYSPLHDPPPIATRKQLWQWELELRTTLINEIKPDLVVMGNRRPGYKKGIFLGSVSSRVAADSPTSVLIVR